MDQQEEKKIRRLIRETISDEVFNDANPADIKAWLFYYKHYMQIADAALGRILRIVTNNSLPNIDRLNAIAEEWRKFQQEVASLPMPNLN